MNNIYTINKLTKVYYFGRGQKQIVLNNLDLTIPANRLTAIYGPSGSGKSTLINIIGKLDQAYSGQVTYKGVPLKTIKNNNYFKNEVSFIFQNYNLINNKTVKQNLLFALETKNLTKKQKDTLITEKLEYLGMLDNLNKEVSKLSGGEKQRVAIARALVQETDIIIADEPTGALDSENTQKTIELFKQIIKDQNKTIIMVTHSKYVKENADYLVELDYGKIINAQYTNKELSENNAEISKIKKDKYNPFVQILQTIKKAFEELRLNWANNLLMSIVLIFAITAILTITGIANGFALKSMPQSSISKNNVIIQTNTSNENFKKLKIENDVKIEEVKVASQGIEVLDSSGEEIPQRFQVSFSNNKFEEANKNVVYGKKAENENQIVLDKFNAYSLQAATSELKYLVMDFRAINTKDEVGIYNDVIGKKIKIQFGKKVKEFEITGINNVQTQSLIISPKVYEELNLEKEINAFASETYLNFKDEVSKNEFLKTNQAVLKMQNDLNPTDPTQGVNNQSYVIYSTYETEVARIEENNRKFIQAITGMLGLGLIVASILIAFVVYSTIEKERKRLAIMQLFGYKQWKIIRYNLLANFINLIISLTIGIILSNVVGKSIIAINKSLAYEQSSVAIGIVINISVIIVMIVSFFALLRIRKVQPIEAIEQ